MPFGWGKKAHGLDARAGCWDISEVLRPKASNLPNALVGGVCGAKYAERISQKLLLSDRIGGLGTLLAGAVLEEATPN